MVKYYLAVIGGGPGGYVAAIRAAQNGQNVVLIEKNFLGGTCLNVGCIPTKSLLAAAETFHQVQNAAAFGVNIEGEISFDWTKMQSRKEETVLKLRNGIGALLKAYGVTVMTGTASFTALRTLAVGEETVEAEAVIIAAGSVPLHPKFIPLHERILNSTALLALEKLPETLLILGGGVIGCEFASLMNTLGVKVTLVEMLPSLLPMFDSEIGRTLAMRFKKEGIRVLTGKALSDICADTQGVHAKAGDEALEADLLLVGIGRAPDLDKLNLPAAGITVNAKGWIDVDEHCRTAVQGIYAIGDVTGRWQLAHAASAMGCAAVDHLCGKESVFNPNAIPGCVFTRPEIGVVGLTTEEAEKANIPVKIAKFPFAALGKALAIGETDGFCKMIAHAENDRILGVHLVGAHASDLIGEAAAAIANGLTAAQLGSAVHPHPTLTEVLMETAHALHGECVHQQPPRKR